MSNWTSGYIADINYTFGYYTELNPLQMQLALLHTGLKPPQVQHACELGFGQGLSVAIHATTSSTQWCGTDFNPSHAGFAQELVQAANVQANLSDEAFEIFCNRDDLPDFDYIGLHGIWSWISDANRTVITDFIRRKLKVGGVLYISYNTQPGWAMMLPVRDLFAQHAKVMGSKGEGSIPRAQKALSFFEELLATEPGFKKAYPAITERLKQIRTHNPRYIAHEYFNQDWQPMTFAEMAKWLEPTKLSFACSAHSHEQIDPLNLTEAQLSFLQKIPDPVFRQSVRDFMCNTQFRRDYWIKGPRPLGAIERSEHLRNCRFVLLTAPEQIQLKASSIRGEMDLNASVYEPLIQALSVNQALSLRQIETSLPNLNIEAILQALLVLMGKGNVGLAQSDTAAQQVKSQTDQLNKHLIRKSRDMQELAYLASPLTGSGIPVHRFAQLFLLAQHKGHNTPEAWAKFAWSLLQAQGERLVKDGAPLETPESNVRHLEEMAEEFAQHRLPVLQRLMMV
jgi:SAM-dependent methyltransferase